MAKYEKFEEWMLAASVTTSNGKKGVVEASLGDDVYVAFANGTSYWYAVSNLEFLEEAPSEEEKAIPWEVGQVVWDVRKGRGVVAKVCTEDLEYPVIVEFDNGGVHTYTAEGKILLDDLYRSLYFSEPKIVAETMPPKKPFVPKLKEGDKIVLSDREMDYITTVVSEDENSIYYRTEDGVVTFVEKGNSVSVYKLGEEIKWD